MARDKQLVNRGRATSYSNLARTRARKLAAALESAKASHQPNSPINNSEASDSRAHSVSNNDNGKIDKGKKSKTITSKEAPPKVVSHSTPPQTFTSEHETEHVSPTQPTPRPHTNPSHSSNQNPTDTNVDEPAIPVTTNVPTETVPVDTVPSSTPRSVSDQPATMDNIAPQPSCTTQRKGRGRSKGYLLDYIILKYGKLKLTFSLGDGRPNSVEDNNHLIGECCRVVRTYAPFRLKSFSAISDADYDHMVFRLKTKLEWDENCPVAKTCIRKTFSKSYSSWKTGIAKRILKCADDAEARELRDTNITVDDWNWWMDYVRGDEYQKISKRNKINRSKQPYGHRAGSRAFVFYGPSSSTSKGQDNDDENDNDGGDGFLEMFRTTHCTPKKGWVKDKAREAYEAMKKLVEESQSSNDGPISERQAGEIVLGPKSGYVRGMGRSVSAPPKSSPHSHAQHKKIKTLESELGAMHGEMAEMRKLIQGLRDELRNGHSLGGSHSPAVVDNADVAAHAVDDDEMEDCPMN